MALKHSYFFRPVPRPESPALPPNASPPEPTEGLALPDRQPRAVNKITLPFLRQTPVPSRSASPVPPARDGTYLEALSLKLSEAVTKALAQPAGAAAPTELLGGRRPIPAGRGTQLGALIGAELQAAAGNANLRRAVIRALQRPMSVLRTNLSSHLLPLLAAPAFLAPSAPAGAGPNATQVHALGYATFAGELADALGALGLGADADPRGDGLKPMRDDLVAMVNRVLGPLVNAAKAELAPLVEALEQPAPARGAKAGPHPALTALAAAIPGHAKALARYTPTLAAQAHLAALHVSLVWRGLVALSAREPDPPSPPATPTLAAVVLDKMKPRAGGVVSTATPPPTPPAGRFALKLPPSRPPSPPGLAGAGARSTPAGDARALLELLGALPRPTADRPGAALAREAVDEAFDALAALATLLEAARGAPPAFADVPEDVPTLVALPVLLRAYVLPGAPAGAPRTVAGLLGMREDAFRAASLAGFGRAEEYAPRVCARVLEVLRGPTWAAARARPQAAAALAWLEDCVASEGEDFEQEDAPTH